MRAVNITSRVVIRAHPVHSPDRGILAVALISVTLVAIIAGGFGDGTNQATLKRADDSVQASGITYHSWRGNPSDNYAEGSWCDGSFIYVCGHKHNNSRANLDIVLLKWTLQGNLVWSRTFNDRTPASSIGIGGEGLSVWGDNDSIYVCGMYWPGSVVIKWDKAGNWLWNQTLTFINGSGFLWYGINGNQDSIYVVGSCFISGYEEQLVLIKWDKSGNQIWNRTWGSMFGYNQLNDEGYDLWLNGTSIYTCGNKHGLALLIKWDENGNQIWNRTFNAGYTAYFKSMWGDDSFLYTCGSQSYSAYDDDFLLVKWNDQGQVVWQRCWGGTNYQYGSDVVCDNQSIFICGTTGEYALQDIAIIKWDKEGNLLLNTTWCGDYRDVGRSIAINSNSVFVCGYTNSFTNSSYEVLLLKLSEAEPPGHGDPPGVIIVVIIFAAGATLATAFSIIKYRARVSKGGRSMGALSARNLNDTVVEKPYPAEGITREAVEGGAAERTLKPATTPVMATPSAARPSAAAVCSRCGNALAPDIKRGKYCGYCGEPFTRVS